MHVNHSHRYQSKCLDIHTHFFVYITQRRWPCIFPWTYTFTLYLRGALTSVGDQNRRKDQCHRKCKVAVQHKSRRAGRMSPCQVSATPKRRATSYRKKRTCICIRLTFSSNMERQMGHSSLIVTNEWIF